MLSPAIDNTEEGRAFLQSRLAVFWKVWFFIGLFSAVLGSLGTLTELDSSRLLDGASTVQAGLFWQLFVRGKRSLRFSRVMEASGLVVQLTLSALMMRYILMGFSDEHPVMSAEGSIMTEGYVTMMTMGGVALVVAIRAALIPSSPLRTLLFTLMAGVPVILVSTFLVPTADGELAWRAIDSPSISSLPYISALYWLFVIITCTAISYVVYGLRAEIREARQLGQYVLEEKLGEGGMGEVYRAHHGMMRRPSAIKLLKANHDNETSVVRFEREVQLTARLTHPNTITIYDYGRTHDGIFYYAMELVDGATLDSIVAVDGALPAGRVVNVLSMACGALAEAHAIGLIHRDIKPTNIMLCSQGGEVDVVKVLDFGLVKEIDVDAEVSLSKVNVITGTPQYMAPESIVSPEKVDGRTDIYALGAVAYYLLTGTAVFNGESVVEVCSQHLHQEPKPFSAHGVVVPEELEALVLACLSKAPEDRPQSALELRTRVEDCQVESWDSVRAQRWWHDHSPQLADASEERVGSAKTIAVDLSAARPGRRKSK